MSICEALTCSFKLHNCVSVQALVQELNFSAYLGLPVFMIPLNGPNNANLARLLLNHIHTGHHTSNVRQTWTKKRGSSVCWLTSGDLCFSSGCTSHSWLQKTCGKISLTTNQSIPSTTPALKKRPGAGLFSHYCASGVAECCLQPKRVVIDFL